MQVSAELRRTALHEASHCITCASQFFQQADGEKIEGGLFLTYVGIVPQNNNKGECGVLEKTDDVRVLNAIDMAGIVATYLATEDMNGILYDFKGDADFISNRMGIRAGNIMSAMGSLLTDDHSQFANYEWYTVLEYSYKLCKRIIETRFLYILALANHLLIVRDMDMRAIHDYIRTHEIRAREWCSEANVHADCRGGWLAVFLKDFSERYSTRTTAIQIAEPAGFGGDTIHTMGGMHVNRAGRTIHATEDSALEAGERDIELQIIVREAGWMKFDEEDPIL